MSTLPFIAYDGNDSEVLVEIGEGTVVGINDKTSSSQILFKHSNPKLTKDSGGWVSQNDPLYEYAKQALAEERTVSFRIEVQRKNGQPLDTPIRELRGENDMAKANKNTSRILASIDNVFSKEAVTNPAEDQTGGRKSALHSPREKKEGGSSAPAVSLDTLKNLTNVLPEESVLTLAALSGEDEKTIRAFAQTAKSSPSKLSAVVFSVVNEISAKFSGIPSDALKNASNGVLYIADSVQVGIFKLQKADRGSVSHEHIRTMVLSRLNQDAVQALSQKDMNYIRSLASSVYDDYQVVLDIAMAEAPTRYLPLEGQQQRPQQQVETPSAPVDEAPAPVEEEASYEEEAPAPEDSVESPIEETPADEAGDDKPFVFSLSADELEELRKGGVAKDDTVTMFANNFGGSIPKEEWGDLANFLEWVFGDGVRSVRKAPEDALRSLIDAYAMAGEGEFRKAVLYVSNNLHK